MNRSRGVTLIEVVVALAIGAALATALLGLSWSLTRLARRLTEEGTRRAQQTRAVDLLRNRLESLALAAAPAEEVFRLTREGDGQSRIEALVFGTLAGDPPLLHLSLWLDRDRGVLVEAVEPAGVFAALARSPARRLATHALLRGVSGFEAEIVTGAGRRKAGTLPTGERSLVWIAVRGSSGDSMIEMLIDPLGQGVTP